MHKVFLPTSRRLQKRSIFIGPKPRPIKGLLLIITGDSPDYESGISILPAR